MRRTSGGRNEREEGSNANEGEGLYRYVPAAVVCNIMITLPACAWLPSSLLSSLSLSLFLSFPSCAYTKRPPSFSGHVAGKYDYCYYLHPPSVVSS